MIKCDITDTNCMYLVLFILLLPRMRIKFEYCTKIVFCFSFIVNCAKRDAL